MAIFGVDAHDANLARHIPRDHPLDDSLYFQWIKMLAGYSQFHPGVALMSGHGGGFVIQNDVSNVLAVVDRLADSRLAGVIKGSIAHKNKLFVFYEWIGAQASCPAQAHARVVV